MTIDLPETLRRPRFRVLIAGSAMNGCYSIELSTSDFGQAGSFFIQIASPIGSMNSDAPWFDSDVIDLSIQMGFLPTGMPEGSLNWQEMMSGRVDRIRLDPARGTVTLEGRDYAARLLDLPVTESFLNCTSSEVARQIAERCRLSTSITTTSAMIGQYYQIEHVRQALTQFSRFTTAWDLLSSLAQLEQYDLWVTGSVLYFQPSSLTTATTHHIDFRPPDRDRASPSMNVSSLVLHRALALGKGVPVSVSSWNSRQRKRIVARSGTISTDSAATINIVRPNLLPDGAQVLADGIFSQTSGHRRTLTATMPGDLVLSPRDTLRLTGIGGSWDGDYRVDSIDREMTLGSGFVQHLTAKTVSA